MMCFSAHPHGTLPLHFVVVHLSSFVRRQERPIPPRAGPGKGGKSTRRGKQSCSPVCCNICRKTWSHCKHSAKEGKGGRVKIVEGYRKHENNARHSDSHAREALYATVESLHPAFSELIATQACTYMPGLQWRVLFRKTAGGFENPRLNG